MKEAKKKLLYPTEKQIVFSIYLSQVRVGKCVIGHWSKRGGCGSPHYRPYGYGSAVYYEATLNNGEGLSCNLKSDLRAAIAEVCKEGIWGELIEKKK